MGSSGISGDGDDLMISKSRFEAPFNATTFDQAADQAAKNPIFYQYTSCELMTPAQAVNHRGRGQLN